MAGIWHRFVSDKSGNIAIMGAASMIVVAGFAALGVDIGTVFYDQRRAQSAADIAALVAASNLGNATNAASAAVQQNGYAATTLASVQLGSYTASSALSPAQRFVTPPVATANAARVTLQTQSTLIFGKLLTGQSFFPLSATATAANTALATFSIGSQLASVNGGLLNAVLGSMLGANLSLSAMDYQSLLGANVDAFSFMNSLATQLNLTGLSYAQLLATNVKVPNLVQALLTALKAGGASSSAIYALNSIAQALNGTATSIVPQSVLSAGPYAAMTVGQMPSTGVSLPAFSLLSAIAELANGSQQIATTVNLNLPGIASATVTMAVGQPPVGTSWITVGSSGASVYTAQTRALLTIQLIGGGLIPSVNLPILVNVASGTAQLTQLSCGYPNISQSAATLAVTPGIINAWIGQIDTSGLTNMSAVPDPTPAPLVSIGPLQITGSANAAMGNTTPTSVTFSYADITSDTGKTVTTTNYTSSLTSSLLGNLSLNVFGLAVPGLSESLMSILNGATSSVDQLVATTLGSLGVGLGQATVWVSGIRCDGAVLVN